METLIYTEVRVIIEELSRWVATAISEEFCSFQVTATARLSSKVEEKIDANPYSLGVIHNPAP